MDTIFLGLKQREKALNVKKSHNNFFFTFNAILFEMFGDHKF